MPFNEDTCGYLIDSEESPSDVLKARSVDSSGLVKCGARVVGRTLAPSSTPKLQFDKE
jgi:hypothetical protein